MHSGERDSNKPSRQPPSSQAPYGGACATLYCSTRLHSRNREREIKSLHVTLKKSLSLYIYISYYYCGPTPSKSPFASIMKRPAWHIPCFHENTGGILVQSLLRIKSLSQYFAWLGTGHIQVYGSWHRVKIAHQTQCQECCWAYIRQHIRCKVTQGLVKVVVSQKVIVWEYHPNWAAVYKTNMTYVFKRLKLCK